MGKHDKRVEVDANTAPLIQSIFLEVAKGLESPFNIRKRLAPHISKSSFFHMLRNIFYIGKVRVPATKNETEVIVVGEHEPLITEEVFWRVQEILDGKYIPLHYLCLAHQLSSAHRWGTSKTFVNIGLD